MTAPCYSGMYGRAAANQWPRPSPPQGSVLRHLRPYTPCRYLRDCARSVHLTVWPFSPPSAHALPPLPAQVDPGGDIAYSSTTDGKIQCWDMRMLPPRTVRTFDVWNMAVEGQKPQKKQQSKRSKKHKVTTTPGDGRVGASSEHDHSGGGGSAERVQLGISDGTQSSTESQFRSASELQTGSAVDTAAVQPSGLLASYNKSMCAAVLDPSNPRIMAFQLLDTTVGCVVRSRVLNFLLLFCGTHVPWLSDRIFLLECVRSCTRPLWRSRTSISLREWPAIHASESDGA